MDADSLIFRKQENPKFFSSNFNLYLQKWEKIVGMPFNYRFLWDSKKKSQNLKYYLSKYRDFTSLQTHVHIRFRGIMVKKVKTSFMHNPPLTLNWPE